MASIVVKFEGRWVQLASRGLDRDGLKRLVRRLGFSFYTDETVDDDTPRCPKCGEPALKLPGAFDRVCLDCRLGVFIEDTTAPFKIVEDK